ncbi:hypothetical protein ACOBQX_23070 [Actinokineospora sp. G85]|uniref:hypothetical protein n=1 Tax=Actinokineospora sp. G85 TaxID=3406626 RepID=UPI003C756867
MLDGVISRRTSPDVGRPTGGRRRLHGGGAAQRGQRGGQRPISYRRYDYLWARMAKHVPAVAIEHISTHWLRHTTMTWVERRYGFGDSPSLRRPQAPITMTYIRAGLEEVTMALAAMTGDGHPVVDQSLPLDGRA